MLTSPAGVTSNNGIPSDHDRQDRREIDILESALKADQIWQDVPESSGCLSENSLFRKNNLQPAEARLINNTRKGVKPTVAIKQENGVARSAEPHRVQSDMKCPHCLISYPDSLLYSLHKMLHAADHPFRCAQCHRLFPNRYEFYAHVVNHGKDVQS